MKIPRAHNQRRQGEAAMTPMIDVVFLLLIFFVCTASFSIAEQTLPTHLLAIGANEPSDVVPQEADLERVVIKLRLADDRVHWSINDRPCESSQAAAAILRSVAEIDASVPVILDATGDVPLGEVIDAYDLCREIGFSKIQFAASVAA